MLTDFKRHKDPFLSTELYIESSDGLDLICYQIAPFGVGMVAKLGQELCDKRHIGEDFIDSTFNTNQQKLEMFAAKESCMCEGLRVAYFVLKMGTAGARRITCSWL